MQETLNKLMKQNHDLYHEVKKLKKELAKQTTLVSGLRATLTANSELSKGKS